MAIYKQPTDEEIISHATKFKQKNPNSPNTMLAIAGNITRVCKVLTDMSQDKNEEPKQPFSCLDDLMANETYIAILNSGLFGVKTAVKRIIDHLDNGESKKIKEPKISIAQTTTALTDEEFGEFYDKIKVLTSRTAIYEEIKTEFGKHTTTNLTPLQKDKIAFKKLCDNANIAIPADWLAEITVINNATVKFPELGEIIKAIAPAKVDEINTVYYCAINDIKTE